MTEFSPREIVSELDRFIVGQHAAKTEAVVFLAAERHDWPGQLGGRQKRLLDELYEARRQGIELEVALREANQKFYNRFTYMEAVCK